MYGCKYRIATPGHGMAWHGVWCLAFDDHIPNDESIFTTDGRMSSVSIPGKPRRRQQPTCSPSRGTMGGALILSVRCPVSCACTKGCCSMLGMGMGTRHGMGAGMGSVARFT